MAARLGVSRQRVQQLEHEKTNHTASTIRGYLEALDAQLLELTMLAEGRFAVLVSDLKRPTTWMGYVDFAPEGVTLYDDESNEVGKYPSLAKMLAAADRADLRVTLNLEE